MSFINISVGSTVFGSVPCWIGSHGNLPGAESAQENKIKVQAKVKQGNIEGHNCSSCNEFAPMAEVNCSLPKGESFLDRH